ncbi:MAG: 5-(carboxyamino)imidazole ribonucleotide mutase [Actinobacteria bacterium]|nr:5-(carboxyamino)imidazole ribonucleotide mutase [Actinomycetota bacterium]NBY15405.1 5-(carboxyamino)imidazole ribonucleotide mutase [Actinomycetota bacterium]
MSEQPLVGVIMGSDSDWDVMEPAVSALAELGVQAKAQVVSAHRMPEEMVEYAKSAKENGLRVIIAGAGGAAHLPGMVASLTTLPVIGVPVPLQQLEGLDSLLSIVQMPAGVPVATVGIGNAKNAGLLAARIIASGSDSIATEVALKLEKFQDELRQLATDKGEELIARITSQVYPKS